MIEVNAIFLNLVKQDLAKAAELKQTVPSFESEVGEAPEKFRKLAQRAIELDSSLNKLIESTNTLFDNAAKTYEGEDLDISKKIFDTISKDR